MKAQKKAANGEVPQAVKPRGARRSKKQERIEQYDIKQLVRSALDARLEASPIASKYHVGAAAMWKNGTRTRGWNIEYGGVGYGNAGMQSVHAEQHMVVSANKDSRRDTLAYLVVIGGQSDDPQAPCGDCREVIKTFSDDKTRIAIRVGGEIKMYGLEELLPTRFKRIRADALPGVEQQLIDRFYPSAGVRGFNCLSRRISNELGEDMDLAYAVARFADGHEEGFQMDDPALHQVSAVASVLSRSWIREKQPMLSLHVFSSLAHLSGRDRQFIFNYASRNDIADSLPVYVTKIGSRQPKSVMQTTPTELLPFGFSESYLERDDADYQRPR